MRKHFIIASSAVALVATVASAGLIAQRQGGPGRGQERAGQPGVEAGDAQGPRRGGPNGPGGFAGRLGGGPRFGIGRHLELTEEQRAKVQDVVRTSRQNAAPIAGQLRAAQRELRDTIFADTTDDANMKELSAKVAELRQQMADIRVSTSASIAELLTPEQREKMRAGMERGPGFGRGGPGRGPGRGAGRGPAPVQS